MRESKGNSGGVIRVTEKIVSAMRVKQRAGNGGDGSGEGVGERIGSGVERRRGSEEEKEWRRVDAVQRRRGSREE